MSSGDVDDSFDGKDSDKEGKKKKNRCAVCRKKVGLTGACHISLSYLYLPKTIDLVLNGYEGDSCFSPTAVHSAHYGKRAVCFVPHKHAMILVQQVVTHLCHRMFFYISGCR